MIKNSGRPARQAKFPQEEDARMADWLNREIEREIAGPVDEIDADLVDRYLDLLYELRQLPAPGLNESKIRHAARAVCKRSAARERRWSFPGIVLIRAACIGMMAFGVFCSIHCVLYKVTPYAVSPFGLCGRMLHIG